MFEIISDNERKARKPHICDYCGGTIAVGEIYNHCVIKGDDIYTWDAHMVCNSVASDLWEYIDPDEGMTEDDFQEGCQQFCRTFICHDCEQWDDECEQGEPFCIQKIYDFLKTHDFVREKRKYGLFVWKCIPKKKEDNGGKGDFAEPTPGVVGADKEKAENLGSAQDQAQKCGASSTGDRVSDCSSERNCGGIHLL